MKNMKNFSKTFYSSNIFKNTFINFSKNNYTSKNNFSDINNIVNNDFKISFYSKIQISKESYVFRFLLPDSETVIGNKVCEYVYLEATMPNNKIFKRPYHPISLDTDKGFIDLMVKIYPKESTDPEYGVFSNYLNTLEEGQVIKMTGSFGKVSYLGKGEFNLEGGEASKFSKKVTKIGMIAGGTGITPMFQLINKIVSTRDPTALSLIYATKFIEDIAFCEDFINFDRSGKLSFFPVVETPNASKWLYGSGRVNEEMISNYMPSPKEDSSIILLCGPKVMIDEYLKPMLRSMKYSDENVVSFS